MVKSIGRSILWILVGLVGSVGILIAAMGLYVKSQVPVSLRSGGTVYVGMWDEGYVAASGTWKIENQKQAFPLQYTEMKCRRSENFCTSATAEIGFYDTLTVDTNYYGIAKWTADTIIITSSASCVDYTYTISRSSQRVIGTRNPKATTNEACPSGVGKEVLQLSLADGAKVQSELEQEVRNRAQPYMWVALVGWWLVIGSRLIRRNATGDAARSRIEPVF